VANKNPPQGGYTGTSQTHRPGVVSFQIAFLDGLSHIIGYPLPDESFLFLFETEENRGITLKQKSSRGARRPILDRKWSGSFFTGILLTH